ncbi:MAG TPA: dihydrofolate reductase family protein [Bdellovibrionales bacterium]|nr:dihydrofolate reductase family protein [Bdellovibrionales bacterium]
MITGHVFIATSLDGFIARKNGDIEWLLTRDAPNEDHGYNDFIKDIDGIVMGRGTFEAVLKFESWPYTRPVVVLSKSLDAKALPAWLQDKVRVMSEPPKDVLRRLAQEGWRKVYVDGGQVVQSFLREKLIADLVITSVPVLLGEGRPLFGPLARDISLKHVETKAFPSGLVQSKYRVLE